MAPPTPLAVQMGLPAVSGSLAVCISHPLELTKVRLQLDNERARRGAPRQYKGWVDCVAQNWRKDGVRGMQRGLSLGVTREFCFNAVRIGLFETIAGHVAAVRHGGPTGEADRFIGGLLAGALGGCCVNPVEVCKTRMQALGGATGHQHVHAGPVAALSSLVKEEGVAGCFKGITTSTVRGFLGPGSQITAYKLLKDRAVAMRGWRADALSTHVSVSLLSAAISIACVNPVDVVRTRVYNQPFGPDGKGLWYAGGADAARQLTLTEGPLAFYKGAGTHFLRLGPHMVLVFMILERLKGAVEGRGV